MKTLTQIREEIRINDAKAAKIQTMLSEEWVAEIVSPIVAIQGDDLVHIKPKDNSRENRAKMTDQIFKAIAPLKLKYNRILVRGCEAWIRCTEVEL